MKIVQSFWSAPARSAHFLHRHRGNWPHRGFNYLSWALSCYRLRRYYDEVELVTDREGQALLIDRLELPYTSVRLDLEGLTADYGGLPQVWALGKIVAYSVQREPFIHVDGDAFLYQAFGAELENSSLVCQQREPENDFHRRNTEYALRQLSYVPDSVREYYDRSGGDCSQYNAGLIGGTDVAFFADYCREAFRFVDRNRSALATMPEGIIFPTLFEQYLFLCEASRRNISVQTYLPDSLQRDWTFSGLAEFHNLRAYPFAHLISFFKEDLSSGEFVAQRLWYENPDAYARITRLVTQNAI